MAYFDDRPGSFVFCRDFVSCEQDWEICIYQKNNKRQKRIQHTDRTSDCCSLYRSYLDGMGAIVCILHLIVFWMVSEAIFALITKIRKKTFAKGGSFFRFTYRNDISWRRFCGTYEDY